MDETLKCAKETQRNFLQRVQTPEWSFLLCRYDCQRPTMVSQEAVEPWFCRKACYKDMRRCYQGRCLLFLLQARFTSRYFRQEAGGEETADSEDGCETPMLLSSPSKKGGCPAELHSESIQTITCSLDGLSIWLFTNSKKGQILQVTHSPKQGSYATL